MNGTANIKFIVIGCGTVCLFVVAILLDLQYLYLMAAALAVLPLASYLLAHWLSARFNDGDAREHAFGVTREHAITALEGRRLPVTLRLAARRGLPQASLRVSDHLPAELRSPDAADAPLPLDDWDGQTGSQTYFVEPARRGVYRLGPLNIATVDPLGLFTFSATVPVITEIVVHPTPLPARNAAVGGEGMLGVREREGKMRRGDGMEFHGVREYRQGDALRRVHWPTTARTGKLAVVEFERAFQQDIVIGLDLARGTEHGQGRETTLEYAVKAAATLVERTLAAGGGVTLVTQTGRVDVQPRDADPAAERFRLFDLLARVAADAEHSLAESLRAARVDDGSHFAILTAGGDPHLTTYLTERVRRGASVRVLFFEPASFGGPRVTSPAVAGGTLRVVRREHSPWQEGGKHLEYLLRDDA